MILREGIDAAYSHRPFYVAEVNMTEKPNEDTFERLNYRSLISWSARIERETPFFESALANIPERSIVDLGCGTGEHARFFASTGLKSVGIDVSAAQIAAAKEYEHEFGKLGPTFFEADMVELPTLFDQSFGAAVCLGNVLPYMEDDELALRVEALAARLLRGGRFVFQILNYQRIVEGGIRSLPINVRPDPEGGDGELVWVRLMTPSDEKHVLFHPITLRYRPGQDPPVELDSRPHQPVPPNPCATFASCPKPACGRCCRPDRQ